MGVLATGVVLFGAAVAMAQSPAGPRSSGATPLGADLFRQRVAEFDKGLMSILASSDNLDSQGNVARNLADADVGQVRKLMSDKLGIKLSRPETRLLANRFVIDARMAGRNWRKTLTLGKFYKPGPGTHGFIAESIDFDDLTRRYPNAEIRFTGPGSVSVDMIVRDPTSKRILAAVQTKAVKTPRGSLAGGLDDAQTFYADKSLGARFELHISKDQYSTLVRAGVLSEDGKLLHPEKFLKQLNNKYAQAAKAPNAAVGSNNARLRGIPKKYGDVARFNNSVLKKVTVRPLPHTDGQVREISEATIQMRGKLLQRSAYAAYMDSLPSNFKLATNAAMVAGAFTAIQKFWQEGVTMKTAEEALQEGMKVSGKAFGSTYVASGILRKYGERVVFNTFINPADMGRANAEALLKTMSAKDRVFFANHMGGAAFLATFIFDETGSTVSFSRGDLTGKEFLFESGKNIIQASAAGAATWGTIILGAAPGGLVVAAVAIGTRVVISKVFQAIDAYEARKNLTLDDFIGRLPASIRNRMTPFTASRPGPSDPSRRGPFDPPRHGPFAPPRRGPFDPPPS